MIYYCDKSSKKMTRYDTSIITDNFLCELSLQSGLLPSSVPVQSKFSQVGTEISIKFDYYHPHPPGKVEIQLEIDKIWSVGNLWIVCMVIFGGRG